MINKFPEIVRGKISSFPVCLFQRSESQVRMIRVDQIVKIRIQYKHRIFENLSAAGYHLLDTGSGLQDLTQFLAPAVVPVIDFCDHIKETEIVYSFRKEYQAHTFLIKGKINTVSHTDKGAAFFYHCPAGELFTLDDVQVILFKFPAVFQIIFRPAQMQFLIWHT